MSDLIHDDYRLLSSKERPNVNLYIPRSEYEVSADGYVDLYLQAAFEPEQSAHYFLEFKYAKANASDATLETKEQEGITAMQTYVQS